MLLLCELHYIVTVNGKQCELDWLELPNSISNIQDFLLILQSLDELNFCNGISVTKFEDVLCDDIENGSNCLFISENPLFKQEYLPQIIIITFGK
jgi:hypothetical protein